MRFVAVFALVAACGCGQQAASGSLSEPEQAFANYITAMHPQDRVVFVKWGPHAKAGESTYYDTQADIHFIVNQVDRVEPASKQTTPPKTEPLQKVATNPIPIYRVKYYIDRHDGGKEHRDENYAVVNGSVSVIEFPNTHGDDWRKHPIGIKRGR